MTPVPASGTGSRTEQIYQGTTMTTPGTSAAISETNRVFYNALWSNARLERPERFNTWPLISPLLPLSPVRLEIGAGLRPRLPLRGTHFIDISAAAVEKLHAGGGTAQPGVIGKLPFSSGHFDLVCAFDVIEHVNDDRQAFAELSRVLKDGGLLIFSVPLHEQFWTAFDDLSGHVRRYDPEALRALLAEYRLVPEKCAAFGMQPSNAGLLKFGMWCLRHLRREAMFFYNRVFMPLGIHFQKRLHFTDGLTAASGVDEVVVVCRRGFRAAPGRAHPQDA